MVIEAFIKIWVLLAKIFYGKQYSLIRVSNVYWVSNYSYDRVARDYYQYVQSLLLRNLSEIKGPCIVTFACDNFDWLKYFLPVFRIALQIEHTLVKTGARDSSNALEGYIPIPHSAEHYSVRIVNYLKLNSADLIFEYSKINQFNVSKISSLKAYFSKTFVVAPALYPLVQNSFSLPNQRKFDTITLFGNPNEPRRRKFLAELTSKQVRYQNVNNVFDGIEDLYRKTKILINIRQTDHHDTLEELRILPALRCGVIIISERAPLVELTGYEKYIIWGNLEELPAIILDVQNNYENWHQKIFQNSGFRRRMERIYRRNELVSLKAVEFLGRRLLDS